MNMDMKAEQSYDEDKEEKYVRPHLGPFEARFAGVEVPPLGSVERQKMERKLKWKIDMTILPCVVLMYIMNYLDRNNIAAAKLGTLEQDLNLSSTQYSTLLSILFVGYIPMTVPSNMILEKIGKPNYYLPGVMLVWGLLSTCIGAVHSYGSLLAIRILLGIFEAAFYPGVIFYLSCWYTRKEIAKRSALFLCGSWLSGAFSGLIAWGVIDNMQGTHGLASWRWLFIIEGVATMGIALIAIFLLPQLPATTRWLSLEERLLGTLRMVEDVGQVDDDGANGEGGRRGAFEGLIMALKDRKTYYFFILLFATATSAGINAVFPTIVDSLGFSRSKTYLLTAPPWLFVTLTSLITSYHSDYTGERFYHILWGPVVSIIAFILGIATTKTAPRYVCMMLILQIYAPYSLLYTWLVNNMPRPPIKRAAAVALINIAANTPNIFVPYCFYNGSSPHFYVGFGFCIAFLAVMITMVVVIRFHLKALNKRLDNGEWVDNMDPSTGFRFIY